MTLPRSAPKPAEFCITRLHAGKKHWVAGESGPPVACTGRLGGGGMPRTQVLLVGKALFGRGRFAFEVQELDNSPANVRKLLKIEKELQDQRFGPDDYSYGGFGGVLSDSDIEAQRTGRVQRPPETVDAIEAFRASELAAKHSIQVKFEDINSIEASGDLVTLKLNKAATCYIKPAGEPRHVNMEVGRDITGGALTMSFITSAPDPSQAKRRGDTEKAVDFSEIRGILMQCSPRLAALFAGLPPPAPPVKEVSTPKGKRKNREELAASATKLPRRLTTKQPPPCAPHLAEIKAVDGTWLKRAVARFGLRGCLDRSVTDAQWKQYFQSRVFLEMSEAATLRGDHSDSESEERGDICEREEEHHESTFNKATWPPELEVEVERRVPHLCFEHGWLEGYEAREAAAEILKQIRSSIKSTVASSALKLDPDAVARGVFLTEYHINAEEDGCPRTVNARAVIFAPNGTGRSVELDYEHHLRGRQSFTEHHSHLSAAVCGAGAQGSLTMRQKIFELDLDEHRRKNPTKTSLATNAALASLGAHLFGVEGVASNRKMFGVLVRAVGLGKFGECNGWPIAVARQRFKCGKEECETDTERISGDRRLP